MHQSIKKARMEAGLSRAEMSRRFEIPIRTIENWEAGTREAPSWAKKLIIEKLESKERYGALFEAISILENCKDLEDAKKNILALIPRT